MLGGEGVEILPSPKAWEKYKWCRKYFPSKPEEGYFIWLKQQVERPLERPLLTCVTINKERVSQNLKNLAVIEKGIKAGLKATCQSVKDSSCAQHNAEGRIVLKEGASLDYEHFHSWQEKDEVDINYDFILQKGATLNYNYKNHAPPHHKLRMKNGAELFQDATADFNIAGEFKNSSAKIEEKMALKEKGASGQIKLRLVGEENSYLGNRSRITANAGAKGHLDCQGLLTSETADLFVSPELYCKTKQAQLTHEASIGKVSEEELAYLRMRGLSEEEATNLIINGFLKL